MFNVLYVPRLANNFSVHVAECDINSGISLLDSKEEKEVNYHWFPIINFTNSIADKAAVAGEAKDSIKIDLWHQISPCQYQTIISAVMKNSGRS